MGYTMKHIRRPFGILLRAALLLAPLLLAPGCATNPVTGRRELHFVSESREVEVGKANYFMYQQAEGGAYVVHPGVNDYVKNVGRKLWAVSDRPHLPFDIVVLNNSVPNAWALPGGKMAVNRGLLVEMETEAELAAVIGHEIVHVAARHGAKAMERGTLAQAAVLGVGLWAQDEDYGNLIVGGAGLTAGLVNLKYGRGAELEADRYGIRYMAEAGYDPEAAVKLQETFLRLSEGKNPGWLAGLFASHPPSQERVDANREIVAQYPEGGTIGRDAYQAAMAPLFENREAYAKLDEGYEALKESRSERALDLAREALQIEPREARAHGLAGRALAAQGLHRRAIEEWNRAIQLDDRYFAYYLHRGQVRRQLGDASDARRDLRASVELLPTATAHYLLGVIAIEDGDAREAREHLRVAASSDSSDGEKARVLLARLELEEAPERYLNVGLGRDNRGFTLLAIENPTAVDVSACTVSVYSSAAGRWESYRVPGGLPSRRTTRLQTRVGPFANAESMQQAVRVRFDEVVVPDALEPGR